MIIRDGQPTRDTREGIMLGYFTGEELFQQLPHRNDLGRASGANDEIYLPGLELRLIQSLVNESPDPLQHS
jgi:hypothetical protein